MLYQGSSEMLHSDLHTFSVHYRTKAMRSACEQRYPLAEYLLFEYDGLIFPFARLLV